MTDRGGNEKNGKLRYSVQVTFFVIYFLFIALMLVLLNTYPTISSRDVVFRSKQSAMLAQASVMASSLSALENLSPENVAPVMELVNVNAFDRVIVTDSQARKLYDTAGEPEGSALFAEICRALEGEVVFLCRYEDGAAFRSRAATPVVSYGRIIGAVYLYEMDGAQARLISGIQARLRSISLIAGALALLTIFIFTKALTRRITDLVRAMRVVREGDYDYRIPARGRDEVAELSEEFNDMTRRLQSTEELRRRFVSDASHELRTPLASIRLLAESVVESGDMEPAMMREFVTDIGSEAERLQRMTEKLMRLTKMDSRAAEKPERVDVRRVAERTVHLLQPLAQAKNVKIFSELEEGCAVLASEDEVYEIVFNLAENAVKYNSFGGNVFLRLHRRGEQIELCVEDTGIGIPEEDMPHIFARFYRVDKARSSEVGGSGLGLSIVHDAALRLGGSVSVQRRETVGSCFTVLFPAMKEEGADE